MHFDLNFTEVCSQGSNWKLPSTGLDNGLVLNRWQVIMWTNADPTPWHLYAALGGDKLTEKMQSIIKSVSFWVRRVGSIDKFSVFVLGC